jgi:predicted nuclease of predicted toxin-antitoxin system
MKFNFTLVDTEDYSFLDISGKKTSYILPSFKFMNFYHIRAIDLAGTGFHDIHMSMLGEYLQSDPELFSICLDNNPLTDASMKTLANALRKNKKVAHLSLCNCPNITDKGLEELYFVIMDHNMVLF